MIRAVCFDFDGVLAPLVEIHKNAFLDTLADWGVTVTPEDHDDNLDGLSTRAKLRKVRDIVAPTMTDGDITRLNALKQERTMLAVAEFKPDATKIAMLTRLKAAGLKLACVSNSIRDTTHTTLRNGGMMGYLDFILSNEDVARQKPDAEPYLMAMRQLLVLPSETLIIEDQPQGIESAKRSGAHLAITPSYEAVDYNFVASAIRDIT